MSFKEVNKLRKNGQLEEAYKMSQQDLESEPDNIWNKKGMSWVLIMYLKQYAHSDEHQKFLQTLQEFRDLQMPGDGTEDMIFENLKYWVTKFLSTISKEESPDVDLFEEFWEIIKEIPYPKPSEMHSSILKFFLKIKKSWDRMEEFLEWWDFSNFRDSDYEYEETEKVTIMPLVERAYLALSRSVLVGGKKNPLELQPSINQEKLEKVLKEMQELYKAHPDYQYLPYYIGKMLYAQGSKEEALKNLLPFARANEGKFWVWTLLGDIHEQDKDLQLACYCRGLLNKEPENMKVGLRKKLTNLLIEKGFYPEAKYELNKIRELQKENGWKVSSGIKQQMGKDWYQQAEMPKNNLNFYRQHTRKTSSLLAQDLGSMVGVVTNVKKERKVLGFIVNKEISGGFNFSQMMDKPNPGDKLEMWYEPRTNKKGESFRKVFHAQPTDKNPKEEIVKVLEGEVKILNGKSFGFLEGAFIPPDLVEKIQLKDEEQIKAKAVLNFDKAKADWGWRVVS
jgi:tetratricopeptide (TPR) repeat protein